MVDAVDFLARAVLIGTGATVVMDVWGMVRKRLLGIASLDYALVGRWLGHLASGRLRHDRIAASPQVAGERAIGWAAHYLIGMGFAGVLLAIFGLDWARQPSIVPGLIVGIGSVAAPFLVMQPAMGAGFAASRTPHPWAARLQSLLTHAVFGVGLYAGGWITRLLLHP
ncbi:MULTISPECIES: DUF2938 domain-containing protein [unclassified Bradyrhizobium]|uniref:DUF2938 domain-containing protein n=1 Tax=unclassified Bradyrhizobium TaxID=2631580 RepID=UPI001BAB80E0|nr:MULTISPECIES: DUF2938 domain-containing protein [unclassified Bradyrhizobium]MBR1206309.1 DUF2938 domain-containing protein [Bradyrhizobium sp. AUGA SZCCT0124]MBR1314975.1 DUF2938 domain-containing protein [Bradyrhizobium sp. AUGA SZCCT0051]MBR1341946.1 DUF2938 domain-containing protein [Bradyrhizobium sp. AUGA SZCCT0105]MBR1358652.1 DUF2938 domain-containing protein [Bradyrhizobium sp. AUGA SZCCT0045]